MLKNILFFSKIILSLVFLPLLLHIFVVVELINKKARLATCITLIKKNIIIISVIILLKIL